MKNNNWFYVNNLKQKEDPFNDPKKSFCKKCLKDKISIYYYEYKKNILIDSFKEDKFFCRECKKQLNKKQINFK